MRSGHPATRECDRRRRRRLLSLTIGTDQLLSYIAQILIDLQGEVETAQAGSAPILFRRCADPPSPLFPVRQRKRHSPPKHASRAASRTALLKAAAKLRLRQAGCLDRGEHGATHEPQSGHHSPLRFFSRPPIIDSLAESIDAY